MKERDPRELASELLEQADETRRLIARYSEESDPWRAKALLACLKNDNALLEALAALLARMPQPRTPELRRSEPVAPLPPAAAPPTPAMTPITVEEVTPASLAFSSASLSVSVSSSDEPLRPVILNGGPSVEGARARQIVEEFDNRDHTFERGLEKLNSWVAGGKGALPFQKRDSHAYLNRSATSDAMIARVESELMGREGFGRRLGILKVDGLVGEILVYERGT